MDLSAALPTFVITLREGVEAALVVGIVLAYLKNAQKTELNPWVYTGVASGVMASVLVGILFTSLIQGFSTSDALYAPVIKPLLEGAFGVVAIAMLSWMLIWMTKQARALKAGVESSVGAVLQQQSQAGWGIFVLIFIAVLREGFETVLFIAANQQGLMQVLGAISGLTAAVGVGLLLFKWGVKINLRQFFQILGVFLLLIVGGLVISALKHFDQALGALATINPQFQSCLYPEPIAQPSSCILGPKIWDTSQLLPDHGFPGIILHTLLGYTDKLYLVQALGYCLFVLTIGGIYLQSITGWAGFRATQAPKASASSQQDS